MDPASNPNPHHNPNPSPNPHHDLVVALLGPDAARPGDGRLVHLVDRHDELGHAQGLGQQRVLPRLPAPLETCLELALRGSDHRVSLCRSAGNFFEKHRSGQDTSIPLPV